MRSIKLIIDSDLKDVALIGMATNRLCSLNNLSDLEAVKIELCVVEAVNNAIIHSYGCKKGHEVEVVFSFNRKILLIDVCNKGTPMDQEALKEKNLSSIEIDPDSFDIPESGRGLMIIKKVMDKVSYSSKGGKSCLSMTKKLPF